MRRVVLDTNVFLDCWVFDDPAARSLRTALQLRRVVAVRSAATDVEYADVIARPRFGLNPAARSELLDLWQRQATLLEVEAPAAIRCADPDDQKFLDLALAAQASVLFTKDKALLATAVQARAHGLEVLAPAAASSVLLFEDDLT